MGGEGLRAERRPVRADLQAGEQAARQIRRVRGLRGRVQVCSSGQQLHVSGGVHARHPPTSHVTWTVCKLFMIHL